MSGGGVHWAVVTTYAGGLEADIAVETLKSVGILAVRRDNDTTGLFGPGFQGPSARGSSVLAPSSEVEEAWEVLGLTPGERSVGPDGEGEGEREGEVERRAPIGIWMFLLILIIGLVVSGLAAVK